ncbi:hypothetical protein GCM10019016_007220 [Streptomyces prasinosporus]|uniref:N-acetyltransferase domain-containing protein n=1 Tax=Streptomyces prasinosporus TaxID=68256 RepID=A0ABP6TEJ3_9ACTN
MAPDGWANGSMFTFGVFLPSGDLAGMLGITMRSFGTGEIGFWGTKEHRGNGYVTEAAVAAARWAFTRMSIDRVEWRAEVGNLPSRAVAERAGFTVEGTLRSAISNKGVLRDCWVGSLLPVRPGAAVDGAVPAGPGMTPDPPPVVSATLYRAGT